MQEVIADILGRRWWAIFAALALVQAGVLTGGWVGYIASDDANYAFAALTWLEEFPAPPKGHAGLRYPVSLPIVGSFRILGVSEFALIAPTVIYFAAAFAATFFFVNRSIGTIEAAIVCLIFGTTPLFAIRTTFTSAEIPEVLFVISSFWLWVMAFTAERKVGLILMSGAAAALALGTRETAAALLLFYGGCFLFSIGLPRRFYLLMALGGLIVIGAEATYYWAVTGDPFHRYTSDFSAIGREHANAPEWDPRFGGETSQRSAWASGEDYVPYFGDYISPIIMLFTRHEIGILFYIFFPAVFWFLHRAKKDGTLTYRIPLLASALAGIWFVFFGLLPDFLALRPRYIDGPIYMAGVVATLFIADLWRCGRKRISIILLVAALGTNLLALLVENKEPIFGERKLIETAAQLGHIKTDPETRRRAEFLLLAHGLLENVDAGLPEQGDYYFYNPKRISKASRHVSPEEVRNFQPAADWIEVDRITLPPSVIGSALDSLGLINLLPVNIQRRLILPHPTVVLYRKP